MLTKELKDIALPWTEEEYRADPALSYSTLATFERGGFHSLSTLFDKKESPSLTEGSAVDTLITGGEEEFNEKFAVMDYNITDGGINVCKALATLYKDQYKEFKDIPEVLVSQTAQEVGFWKDPKWNSRRYKEVLNTGDVDIYYQVLTNSSKIILSTETYTKVLAMVDALKTSESTKFYFEQDNPFDDSIRRYYQLKFKATLDNNISYRAMLDLIWIDYKNKKIHLCDLKTSGHPEDVFPQSFLKWNYLIQSKLYTRLVQANIEKDDYFKDFTIEDFTFIVVNKDTLTPLTWKFKDFNVKGSFFYGKDNTELRDPEEIGKELTYYLNNDCKVPIGISITEPNDIVEYLNTKM